MVAIIGHAVNFSLFASKKVAGFRLLKGGGKSEYVANLDPTTRAIELTSGSRRPVLDTGPRAFR